MNLKFLPIGTVCLVENIAKKVMIIGYSKSGYDYVAVNYPKDLNPMTNFVISIMNK